MGCTMKTKLMERGSSNALWGLDPKLYRIAMQSFSSMSLQIK